MLKADAPDGYYWQPTISGDKIVFVSEDDLWTVSAQGGVARRLTGGPGPASCPCLSPDGALLAYIGAEEGNTEVYVMDADGGPSRRLSWLGRQTRTIGWTPDGEILISSTAGSPFNTPALFTLSPAGGPPVPLNLGTAAAFAFGPPVGDPEADPASRRRPAVLTRFQDDPARWKRYRGGRAGVLWVDAEGEGQFQRLLPALEGNHVRGDWLGDQIIFLSDFDGMGRIYACGVDGGGLRALTGDSTFYARGLQSDGSRAIFSMGADLYVLDGLDVAPRKVEIALKSARPMMKRRFVPTGKHLEYYDLHPKGHSVVITSRGKPSTMALWEGAVQQHGVLQGVRYRLTRYMPDGEHFIAISDQGGQEALEIWRLDGQGERRRLDGLDLGRAIDLEVSPDGLRVALSNHRHELLTVNLDAGALTLLDRSPTDRISGMSWSPDSQWLAYGLRVAYHTAILKVAQIATGTTHALTRPEFYDFAPHFGPDGRHLYFISQREFDPVYDAVQFDLGFPRSMKLCLTLLRDDLPDPFEPTPRPVNGRKDEGEPKAEPFRVDLEGIEDRVLAFPLAEGRFGSVKAAGGFVYFTSYPIEGGLGRNWHSHEPKANATLRAWDFKEAQAQDVAFRVTDFGLGRDGKTLIVRSTRKLRVMPADGTNNKKGKGEDVGRKSGWLDLGRVQVQVDPASEWRQMFEESWRLMAQQFWRADMGGVDWEAARARYLPLLDRVGARSELSDVLWEMQGELGTSHAYEMGGDYAASPLHHRGFLGAALTFDPEAGGARIDRILKGDNWHPHDGPPLGRPGSGIRVGDVILAVDGQPVTRDQSVDALLVNKAGNRVALKIAPAKGGDTRTLTLKTLRTEIPALYRDWVNAQRALVHARSQGRLGYVHIPDMGPSGYAEFHRAFMAELHRPGLIIDVRYNRGGHVSQLLIQKLTRRRLGHDQTRWREPFPYPRESVAGPLVALTNEFAGSDGDIFSHAFKASGAGILVGKRTWGGTIGIWPRHYLVDGTVTTQPEFSGAYEGVGFGLENHGAEVDVEVEITPQDTREGRDPQLDAAVEIALAQLDAAPAHRQPDEA